MIFELVELAKESLTDNNLPCGDCVVCLLPFQVSHSPFTCLGYVPL